MLSMRNGAATQGVYEAVGGVSHIHLAAGVETEVARQICQVL